MPRNPKNKHFRRDWIQAMLDHEIGTHFMCAINDAHTSEYLRGTFSKGGNHGFGAQKRAVTQREALCTEEGLATLNTHMSARVKLLWGPALAYWTRWMGSQLSFSELFEALEPYVPELPRRWVQCYRTRSLRPARPYHSIRMRRICGRRREFEISLASSGQWRRPTMTGRSNVLSRRSHPGTLVRS